MNCRKPNYSSISRWEVVRSEEIHHILHYIKCSFFSFMLFGVTTYSAEPIKIGFNLEITGAVAGYGQMGWEGAQLMKELVPLKCWAGLLSSY